MPTEESSGAAASPDASSSRFALLAVLVVAASCFLVHQCHQPPAVVAADAPKEVFSGQRAFGVLERLLADERPHPLGTPENDAMRARLLDELETLDLKPTVNEYWIPQRSNWVTSLQRVRNVSAILPSTHPDRLAVVLACHYDSVAAGPGAGDDGAGVAALIETARALLGDGPLPRPVILLFTDGEELNLFGASAFCNYNPLAKQVGIILNLEARGNSGGSLMFETSPNNAWMLAAVDRGWKRPMSSSAYVEIYGLMPNSSDVAVFLQHGLPCMNFGFLGNPKHYHTPLDNLANLDRRSLQHHGDNILGMTRRLLTTDLERAQSRVGDLIYTDLGARTIIAWPAALNPWLSGVVLLILFFVWRNVRRTEQIGWKQIARCLYALPASIFVAAVLSSLGLGLLWWREALPTWFPAAMHFDIWFFCTCATLGALLLPPTFHVRPAPLALTHATLCALLAFAHSFVLPGFAYLWLLPAAVMAGTGLLWMRPGAPKYSLPLSCLAVTVVSVLVWFPLLLRLPLALGALVAPALGAAVALLLAPSFPLFATLPRRVLALGSLALVVVAAIFGARALQTPPYSEASPQQLSYFYVEKPGQANASLSILAYEEPFPVALTSALEEANLGGSPISPPGPAYVVAAADFDPPEIALLERGPIPGGHRARVRIRPSLTSQHLLLGVPLEVDLRSVIVKDHSLPFAPESRDDHRWVRIRGIEAKGMEVEFTWSGDPSLPLVIAGVSHGLPPHLAPLVEERRKLPSTTAHLGDQTIIYKQVTIEEE